MYNITATITTGLVDRLISRFEAREGEQDALLSKLFDEADNADLDNIIVRVALIDVFYNTQIQNFNVGVVDMAKRIQKNHDEINQLLKSNNIEFRAYELISGNNDGPNACVFASKFLHFSRPDCYPIMDSITRNLLGENGKSLSEDITYQEFCMVFKSFRNQLNQKLQKKYSIKEIDEFLWEYGKVKKSIEAKDFLNEFVTSLKPETLTKTGTSLLEVYKNDAKFTPVVINIINEIIEATGVGYKAQKEYYRIDVVGWITKYEKIKKEANEVKLNPHLWDLKIAVEHENSMKDWTDEIVKLVHIRCPLKVVICYNNYDKRGQDEVDKLSFVASIMQKTDEFANCEGEEYLVIIGNGCHSVTKKSDYMDFNYKGYLYNWTDGKFDRIILD